MITFTSDAHYLGISLIMDTKTHTYVHVHVHVHGLKNSPEEHVGMLTIEHVTLLLDIITVYVYL